MQTGTPGDGEEEFSENLGYASNSGHAVAQASHDLGAEACGNNAIRVSYSSHIKYCSHEN
eukprot:4194738-Amphidinium_carterae.1